MTNEDFKAWVDAEKGRIQWLAERTKLSLGTLYNYRSTRRMSESNAVLLEYAMAEYENTHGNNNEAELDIDISDDDIEAIRKYANQAKMDIDSFVTKLLEEKIREKNESSQ